MGQYSMQICGFNGLLKISITRLNLLVNINYTFGKFFVFI